MSRLTIFELLNLRSEWEETVRGFKRVNKESTLENLQTFVDNGYKSNRLRPKYEQAMEIAQKILDNA